jgi:SAM-dependent methyltransferase
MLGPGVTEYVGVDREGELSNPTVVGSAEALPFDDEAFDVVLSTQVLEHVPDPSQVFAESVRVLKRGGRLVLTVPGVWPTHEAPHDYWRFTRHGLKRLLVEHGIDCAEPEALGKLWATIGQMANLELGRRRFLRELVPLVNCVAGWLDRTAVREDLVMAWFVDGTRKP